MLKGLLKLSWIETKVFLREPLGVIGSLGLPVILFLVFGRALRGTPRPAATLARLPFNVTIVSTILLVLATVQSLIAIIAIYREGGILKRLRATPLAPVTILGAQVLVKLTLTFLGLVLLMAAGKRILPDALPPDLVSFSAAVLLGTFSILSLGFVLASLVPTARLAQPLGAAILYPMLALSGLFFPIDRLPRVLRALAAVLPTTHAVALMQGVWAGVPWSDQLGRVAALLLTAAVCVAISTRWFRWE